MVLRVGLTGGVASGKSAVARLLAACGASVRDADAVVAELYRPGGAGTAAVRELFGVAVLAQDGSVDRSALVARVLDDAEQRRRLEAAVHPLVRQSVVAWFTAIEAHGDVRVGVFEAALLVETGMYREFDRLVVVTAPARLRRARALEAGWDAARLEGIMAAQTDDRTRTAVADFVVDNDGDLVALEERVDRLWRELTAVAETVGPGPRATP